MIFSFENCLVRKIKCPFSSSAISWLWWSIIILRFDFKLLHWFFYLWIININLNWLPVRKSSNRLFKGFEPFLYIRFFDSPFASRTTFWVLILSYYKWFFCRRHRRIARRLSRRFSCWICKIRQISFLRIRIWK